MSEGTIIALAVAVLTALPPTIVALAAYRQSKIAAAKSDIAAVKSDIAADKSDIAAVAAVKAADTAHSAAVTANIKTNDLITKSEEIHVLVNSNLSQVKKELEDANTRIESLELLVKQLLNGGATPS